MPGRQVKEDLGGHRMHGWHVILILESRRQQRDDLGALSTQGTHSSNDQ
jgi:hypothetical protein